MVTMCLTVVRKSIVGLEIALVDTSLRVIRNLIYLALSLSSNKKSHFRIGPTL